MDKLSAVLEPQVIVDFLRQKNCHDYEPMLERVQFYLDAKQVEDAACEMLRGLPYCSDAMNSERRLHRSHFVSDLGNFRATIEAENMKQSSRLPGVPQSLNRHLLPACGIPTASLSERTCSSCKQRKKHNCLCSYRVWKDAGCNRNYSDSSSNQAQGRKIARALMLVPTVPLVDQQTVELVKYLAGEFWVDGFSGAENLTDRAGHFLTCDVCVVTPQIVINMMNSILKQEKIYFSDITMMIFDECHNCNEQHPYKILMEMLERVESSRSRRYWDIGACREHMLKMCSYLLADSIMLRVKHPSNDEFAQLIKETMIKIQQRIMPVLEKLLEFQIIPLTRKDITFPDYRYTDKYQNVVGGLRKLLQFVADSSIRLWLVRSIEHLSHYFHAIGISHLLPNHYGLVYLDLKMCVYTNSENEEDVNEFLLDSYNSVRERLYNLAKIEKTEDKEILQKLYGILHDQYSEKPESRTIIFVATRACAKSLSEHLSDYLSKCDQLPMFFNKPNQAGYMTSANQSVADGGQSGDMQRTMRDRFQRGEIKVLVVTSVADEGINIMKCNLIIKYNSVGSERTLIQRRGRARDKDSRAILLALDTGVEQQEFDNMKKEVMMLACIKDLQAHQDEALSKMILDKTEKLKALYEQKRDKLQKQREILSTRKYQLKCRVCNRKICDSTDVRSVADSFYVCVDPQIWTRSKNEIIKKPTLFLYTLEDGITLKRANVFLPSLTAKSFVMERFDTKEQMSNASVKKGGWSKIQNEYFNIHPICSKTIKDMLHALIKVSEEDHAMLERQEFISDQLLLDGMRDFQKKGSNITLL
uniref:RNA helicase n=1 Tax=Ditylenchus dipsaci TaxID=166011 RepID=A0A915DQ37_9BILA